MLCRQPSLACWISAHERELEAACFLCHTQFYYLFGFLCLVAVILTITCAEITIVLCYFQLCSEDYHWWCVPAWFLAASVAWSLMHCFCTSSSTLRCHWHRQHCIHASHVPPQVAGVLHQRLSSAVLVCVQ